MLFNTLQFVVFFIVVTIAYFLLNHKYRWSLLLLSSCYFYMVFAPVYILILAFTIVVDYFAGIFLEKISGNKRKLFLIGSLVVNIGVLVLFKYYNFLNYNLSKLFGVFHWHNPIPALSFLLPIGLSFHTFQAMSYTFEVYRGKQKAERHLGIYALYVMFYPQLVAGPIERPQNLLPQFYAKHKFDSERVKSGLLLMLWGFFKKIVIADRLAQMVDYSYSNILAQNGLSLLVSTIFYSFQIYCDFSGYSDIAIGAARIMGFTLMDNFKQPYLSKSISAFWKRWHISLSSWFKDYLYIPLGGNRVKPKRWYFNLLLVFVLSGVWHGANGTFFIWGAIHAAYLIFAIEKKKYFKPICFTNKTLEHLNQLSQIAITFLLVTFAWIFFRAKNVATACLVVSKIASFSFRDPFLVPLPTSEVLFSVLLIGALMLKEKIAGEIKLNSHWGFALLSLSLVFFIYLFGVFNHNQFIYFQF